MEIYTKFKLGQTVFYMENNNVKQGIIGYIEVILTAQCGREPHGVCGCRVQYGLILGYLVPSSASYPEFKLFESKEALIETL
jgi:hypothetical protein